MVKVLHVTPSMARGGSEKFLAGLLPRLAAKGFHIELVSLFDSMEMADSVREAGIDIRVVGHSRVSPFSPSNILKCRRVLGGMIRSSNPDIINSNQFMANMMAGVSAPLNSRIVVTLQNSESWWFWREMEGWNIKFMAMTMAQSFLGRMRDFRYFAVSESCRSDAMQKLGMPGGSVRLVYNSIEPDHYPVRPESVPGGRPTIIQVGNYRPQKGHITSVKAMEVLLKSVPDARIRLVGDGPIRPEIEAEVEKRGLGGAVEFLGSRDDVPELLRRADVYWMPSTFEGFSLACLEAMASGLPCIVTDAKGLNEAVADGVTGYIVPVGDYAALADKTAELLGDPALARSMGLAGRKRVAEEFSVERAAEEYEKGYLDIMDGAW